MGVEVIEMDCDLDWTFPKYNPNPEDTHMLHEMAKVVRETGADLALGFDGDGDRCGVVDDDRRGDLRRQDRPYVGPRPVRPIHKDATFVVDVKSTGLYATDEKLKANGATTVYWKTGHSYIKRKTAELEALSPASRSPVTSFSTRRLGRGYDDGLVRRRQHPGDDGSQSRQESSRS